MKKRVEIVWCLLISLCNPCCACKLCVCVKLYNDTLTRYPAVLFHFTTTSLTTMYVLYVFTVQLLSERIGAALPSEVIQCANEGFGSRAPTSQPSFSSTDECRCRLIEINATIGVPRDAHTQSLKSPL